MMMVKSRIKGIYLKFEQQYFGEGILSMIPTNVIGDKMRFQQILVNLTSNAIANTFDGGVTIVLNFDKEMQMIQVNIEDTGIGIQNDQQAEITKIFKSLNAGPQIFDKKSKTVGLGLCICKQILNSFGGRISFNSVYKKGSSFFFDYALE